MKRKKTTPKPSKDNAEDIVKTSVVNIYDIVAKQIVEEHSANSIKGLEVEIKEKQKIIRDGIIQTGSRMTMGIKALYDEWKKQKEKE